ncbi:21 kDa protein [Phtheirospermum japonicum]|uniref:21 kDa protein n=1 Tax=Phtheirospermum japonicum TaxID=374723 RepID=A0A830CSF2_9LAMI|nr:21 kDa protein [Phtheirospermum japonicum]
MSPLIIFSLVYALTTAATTTTTTATTTDTQTSNLIIRSCKNALYQKDCVNTLNSYTSYIRKNPTLRQVAKLSVAISIKAINNTQALVNRNLDSLAEANDNLKECNEHMGNSLDNLYGSFGELKKSGSPNSQDYNIHMSNVMTWLSSALTDASDCKDLLSDLYTGGNRAIIRSNVAHAGQMISNALAVCNKLTN